jgi:hypothetical protein
LDLAGYGRGHAIVFRERVAQKPVSVGSSLLGGSVGELFATLGAVAAGGGFAGSALAYLERTLRDASRRERLETAADAAVYGGTIAVVLTVTINLVP